MYIYIYTYYRAQVFPEMVRVEDDDEKKTKRGWPSPSWGSN